MRWREMQRIMEEKFAVTLGILVKIQWRVHSYIFFLVSNAEVKLHFMLASDKCSHR